ncbi:MAG: hypothetical protein CBC09_08440 [Cellvibrionales bacterium TMED49]|nr:MAG: hypothetical protein CBC09_08440 [Cellvibrionales bacterium TMED49]
MTSCLALQSYEAIKSRQIGLGAHCPNTNILATARTNAIDLKAMINKGIDPIEQSIQERRRALAVEKANKIADEKNQATFNKVALEFIESKKAEWKNAKHHQQWVNTLTTYAFAIIGHIRVADVETAHVLVIVKPIWNTKTETAKRVRTRLEAVLRYAEAHNWRTGGNPARWRGHLSAILPNPQKLKELKHHLALAYDELPQFMGILSNTEGMGARTLELTILTETRTKESLGARWEEFDLNSCIWTIQKERIKPGVFGKFDTGLPPPQEASPKLRKIINIILTITHFFNYVNDAFKYLRNESQNGLLQTKLLVKAFLLLTLF